MTTRSLTIPPDDYQTFLQSKRVVVASTGIDVSLDELPIPLFPFQKVVVQWALARGRAAIFADCGLGKSFMQIAWAELVHTHTDRDVLILAPLAVAGQTVIEGQKLGITVQHCRKQADVKPGVNITNYEMLSHFDPHHFAGVVLDECFAPNTPIDTPNGPVPIKDIRVEDVIYNAYGIDQVSDVHRREVHYAVRITVNGTSIISSPNHPYFTQRGWVGAQDLRPCDQIMATSQAVRVVWDNVHSALCPRSPQAFLRDILLSEMADESARTQSESTQSGSGEKARRETEGMVSIGQSQSAGRVGANPHPQPNGTVGNPREDLPPIERNTPQTFRAWGQWNWIDGSTADTLECSWRRLESGICFITGGTDSWLSHALQARHRQSQAQNCYRGGWRVTSQSPSIRSEEGCETGFAWVDSLEILEQGHPDLERLRDADGRIYLYDIGATRHPSFSVNGLLVHNSSILKSFTGVTKRALVEAFVDTPYKLCCSATPSPNHQLELLNQSQFLGIMESSEALMRWFINDTSHSGNYRLKGHAVKDFWEWVASWAICLRKPSDLGPEFSDAGYVLPELHVRHMYIETDITVGVAEGQLFRAPKMNATNMHKEMRLTAGQRAQVVADLVNESQDTWIVWCHTDYEADELVKRIPDAVEVRGSEKLEAKESKLNKFMQGEARVLIAKPRMFGYGLNFQFCHHVAFVGLSYSMEDFYQAVRRVYRFGQQQAVEIIIVAADTEATLVASLDRKLRAHIQMNEAMQSIVERPARQENLKLVTYAPQVPMVLPDWANKTGVSRDTKVLDQAFGPDWAIYQGDCVKVIEGINDHSIDFTIFSPPFANLYVYSDSECDMGNCSNDAEFFEHFDYLIPQLLRVTRPGRLCAVHCKQLVNYTGRDGAAGLRDFRGEIIKHFSAFGWVYHSEVNIWKSPVTEMHRTKAHGLLYKTLRRDSTYSRQGLADYLLIFRKWPQNEWEDSLVVPVTHTRQELPLREWQKLASPVWEDIVQTEVLNIEQARESQDEKHICPLQLPVIRRATRLWTNPGDIILSPFAGIGSEGHEALRLGRCFMGIELKSAYYEIAKKNLKKVLQEKSQGMLFGEAELTTLQPPISLDGGQMEEIWDEDDDEDDDEVLA